MMDKTMNDFIRCCLELGKELLNKDVLTDKEEGFFTQLNAIVEKYLN